MKIHPPTWLCRFALVLAAACPAGTTAAALVRGPYVQMGHYTNQATIVWRTDSSSDSAVDYGLTTSYGQTATGPSGWQHEVTLTGLIPGTTYYYRVRSGGATLASASFRSGKSPGTPFRIGLFSDAHYGANPAIGTLLAQAAPDLLLAVGDVSDDGLYADLDTNIFGPLGQVLSAAPLYWTPGNHDVRDDFAVCREAFVLPGNELSYWFEYADAQIVSLNAEGLPGTGWLANALAASSKPWKIVFFHEPAYSPDGGHGEEETIRDQYVPILEQHGVDLVVSGHNHFYWRSAPIDGVQYLITGPTGSRTREAGNTPCYSQWVVNGSEAQTFILLDIAGTRLRVQTFDAAGNLRDETALDRTCPFALDGELDPGAVQVAARPGGQTIWAVQSNNFLYVATPDAGEGSDAFLFLASAPDALANPAPWGKAGNTLAYDAFLADENDNNYSHGFAEDGLAADVTMIRTATPWCNNGVLEAVIDLSAYYGGAVPDSVFLAAALYGNADAGALAAASQCPAGNGDGNLDPDDVVEIPLSPVTGPVGPAPSASFSPPTPVDCGSITVTFNAATSVLANAATVSAFYHFSTNSDDWVLADMSRTGSNTFVLVFDSVPDNAPQLEVCFTDGIHWENRGGANWKVVIRDCEAPLTVSRVTITPGVPTVGQPVAVSYDPAGGGLAAASIVNIHHGYNRTEGWTAVPGVPMTKSGAAWTCSYVVPEGALSITMCFNDGTTWDNNGGADWDFPVMAAARPPVPADVVITNPPASVFQVDHDITQFVLEGTAGYNLAGTLYWTNSATGQGGSFPRTPFWSQSVELAVGANDLQITGIIPGAPGGAVTIAWDRASAYTEWANDSAQGSGWSAGWTLFAEGETAGHFLDTVSTNCSAGSPAFGLWANNGATARARRPLAEALQPGDTLSFVLDNNWINDGGSSGFSLENTHGEALLTLYFIGGETVYKLQDGSPEIRETGMSWTGDGLTVAFTLDSATNYTLVVNGNSFTGTLIPAAGGTGVQQFQTWNYNCGPDTERNVYFNNLQVTRSQSGEEDVHRVATVSIIRLSGDIPEPFIAGMNAPEGGGLRISMANSVPDVPYAIYVSETLIPTQNWQLVTGTLQAGNGGTLELVMTNDLPVCGFYRIGGGQP